MPSTNTTFDSLLHPTIFDFVMITFIGCPSTMWSDLLLTECTLAVFDSICISIVRTSAQKSAQAHTATAGAAGVDADGGDDMSPTTGPFLSQGAMPNSPSLQRPRRDPARVQNEFLEDNAHAAQDLFDFMKVDRERGGGNNQVVGVVGRPPAWTRGEKHLTWSSSSTALVGLDPQYSVAD